MILDVDHVLTPKELKVFEGLTNRAINMAKLLGRNDKVVRLTNLLNQTRRETCQVYPTK